LAKRREERIQWGGRILLEIMRRKSRLDQINPQPSHARSRFIRRAEGGKTSSERLRGPRKEGHRGHQKSTEATQGVAPRGGKGRGQKKQE